MTVRPATGVGTPCRKLHAYAQDRRGAGRAAARACGGRWATPTTGRTSTGPASTMPGLRPGHPIPRRPPPAAVHHGVRPARGLPFPCSASPSTIWCASTLRPGPPGSARSVLHPEGHRRLGRHVRPLLRDGGLGPGDRVQIMVGYGLWTAGVGFQAGFEALGRRRSHRPGQPGHAGPVLGGPADHGHLLHGLHGACSWARRSVGRGLTGQDHPATLSWGRSAGRRHARAHRRALGRCADLRHHRHDRTVRSGDRASTASTRASTTGPTTTSWRSWTRRRWSRCPTASGGRWW